MGIDLQRGRRERLQRSMNRAVGVDKVVEWLLSNCKTLSSNLSNPPCPKGEGAWTNFEVIEMFILIVVMVSWVYTCWNFVPSYTLQIYAVNYISIKPFKKLNLNDLASGT
jgi:hypothetical protein